MSLSIWYRRTQHQKTLGLLTELSDSNKARAESDEKIKDLLNQLTRTAQELAIERTESASRDLELKSLLKLHADQLYKSLCEN